MNINICLFFIIQFIKNVSLVYFYDPIIDHIEIVTVKNFTEIVLNSERLTVLECYAHWCGYSKKFIPHWKNFSSDTLLWHKKVLRVAAIDCASANNFEICQKNRITKFPLFRWFNAYNNNETGIDAENETSRSEKFMHTTIDFLELHPKKPSAWPELSPYLGDLDHLFKEDTHNKYVFLIAESNSSYVGRQIILDFSNYQDKIDIRRVTAFTNPNIFIRLNIDQNNTLDTVKVFIVKNTHEGPKKFESLEDSLAKLKTDKIYNPDLIDESLLNRTHGIEQNTRYEIVKNIFTFMKYSNLEFDPSAIDL